MFHQAAPPGSACLPPRQALSGYQYFETLVFQA
jgi:hypothetical protein